MGVAEAPALLLSSDRELDLCCEGGERSMEALATVDPRLSNEFPGGDILLESRRCLSNGAD